MKGMRKRAFRVVLGILIAALFIMIMLMVSESERPSALERAEDFLARHPEFSNMTLREALAYAKAYPLRAEMLMEAVCTYS